jgi:hypothetical protein
MKTLFSFHTSLHQAIEKEEKKADLEDFKNVLKKTKIELFGK